LQAQVKETELHNYLRSPEHSRLKKELKREVGKRDQVVKTRHRAM